MTITFLLDAVLLPVVRKHDSAIDHKADWILHSICSIGSVSARDSGEDARVLSYHRISEEYERIALLGGRGESAAKDPRYVKSKSHRFANAFRGPGAWYSMVQHGTDRVVPLDHMTIVVDGVSGTESLDKTNASLLSQSL